MSEEEKRQHRCCFSGHRQEKLKTAPERVLAWLDERIEEAVREGFVTFITGMGMGVDLWAAETVLEKKKVYPFVRLIAAAPYPGFSRRWSEAWKARYEKVWQEADLTVYVRPAFENTAFQQRNEWMVRHSRRLIAFYNGDPGGTDDMIRYAREQGIETMVYAEKEETEDKEGGNAL